MKTLILRADEKLIEAAHLEARRRKTTLNAEFRAWLTHYARNPRRAQQRVDDYRQLMDSLEQVSSGRRFSRDGLSAR